MVALGWEGSVTILVLGLGLVVMIGDWLAPHLTFCLMVGVLMASTVIDTRAGAAGFSNTGVLTVVVLYAVAEGVSQTGGLDVLMSCVLGTSSGTPRVALIRMMLPVVLASAFLNNTPIVALMIPILISWGRRCDVSPKVLLLPLSYASILGGTMTLIGTSTNLVIAGLQAQRYAGTADAVFSFFDITPYGLPYGAFGVAYVLFVGMYLLPKDTGSRPMEDLLLAAEVGTAATLVAGKSLEDSGLLHLSGVRLFTIIRKGQVLLKAEEEDSSRIPFWRRMLPFQNSSSASSRIAGASNASAAADKQHSAAHVADILKAADQSSYPASASSSTEGDTPASQPHSSMVVLIKDDAAADTAVAAASDASSIQLQAGDLLHFHGDLKQLQEHADRLGLILLTSNHQNVHDVLHAAAGIRPNSTAGRASLDGCKHPTAAAGQQQQLSGAGARYHRSSLGWSGKTMWLFRAVVKKNAPVVGRSLDSIDMWGSYGVIVVGAELGKGKTSRASNLGQLVLQPGDLLVFIARNDKFKFNSGNSFAESFHKVQFMHESKQKDFLIAMRVKPGRSGAAGKSIAANGLRDINGLHIVAISRPGSGEVIVDASPHCVLQEDDVLWFNTDTEGVKYLLKEMRLEAVEAPQAAKLREKQIHRHLVQVTVAPNSSLIGHTAHELRFKTYYDAALMAIHRQSGNVQLISVADVRFDAGDVLLLETDLGFSKRFATNPAFGLVSDVPHSSPLKARLMWPAVILTAAMVVTQAASGVTGVTYIDLWPAAILTAAAMLGLGCMNADQALAAIDWSVYITIAMAFGVSAALEKSKVAAAIASAFVTISKAIGGRTAALACMYLVTGLLSEVLSNNAAAALMYPIAAAVGDEMGVQPKIMSVAVMLGASAALISPFGYQCNLMVFNAGAYRTVDFVKVGILFQVWQAVAATLVLSMPDQWIYLCAASAVFFAAALGYVLLSSWRSRQQQRQEQKQLSSTAGRV